MAKGGIADMRQLGIRESFKSKLQVSECLPASTCVCVGVCVETDRDGRNQATTGTRPLTHLVPRIARVNCWLWARC